MAEWVLVSHLMIVREEKAKNTHCHVEFWSERTDLERFFIVHIEVVEGFNVMVCIFRVLRLRVLEKLGRSRD